MSAAIEYSPTDHFDSSDIQGFWSKTNVNRTSSDSLHDTLSRFLANELGQLDEVKAVRVSQRVQNGTTVVHVWTTLSLDNKEVRYRVYEKEERLMAKFPGDLFDFHVHLEGQDLPVGDEPVYRK